MREMTVEAMEVDPVVGRPLLMLREVATPGRLLPVWIGSLEAEAVGFEHRCTRPRRSAANRLLAEIVEVFARRLELVVLTTLDADIDDGQVHAELWFEAGVVVLARVDDAIALALNMKVPVLAGDKLLNAAGMIAIRNRRA